MMKTAILLLLGTLCPCVYSQFVNASSPLSGTNLTTDITVQFTTGYRSAAALNAVYQSGLFDSDVARSARQRYHNVSSICRMYCMYTFVYVCLYHFFLIWRL